MTDSIVDNKSDCLEKDNLSCSTSSPTPVDPSVDNKSGCLEKDISCSTSSPTPVDPSVDNKSDCLEKDISCSTSSPTPVDPSVDNKSDCLEKDISCSTSSPTPVDPSVDNKSGCLEKDISCSTSSPTPVDPSVDNKSGCLEKDILSCSTSSPTPVDPSVDNKSGCLEKDISCSTSSPTPVDPSVDSKSGCLEKDISCSTSSPTPVDPSVDSISGCLEEGILSCSTSSPTPVDPSVDHDVLTDTSNLDDKSKSLSKESPIKEESIEDVKHESLTSGNEKKNNFEIGDIVWAKIGKYPFWPSIVCIDPDTNTYLKGSLENKKKFSLHVRFCNDNGRRSWAKVVEMYDGKDKLLQKHPNGLALIKNSLKQMTVWDAAVKEADNWLKVKRNERMVRFSNKNGLSLSEMNALGASKIKSPRPSSSKTRSPHPSSSKTRNRSLKHKTASTQPHDGSYIPTVEEFLASRRAIDLAAQAAKCEPSTSGSHVMKSGASTSSSSMPQCYVKLKDIVNTKPMAKVLEKPMEKPMELPKKAVKRKYVDPEKKRLREVLKKKKAKRALQVKKYGFSYSSSEYESTDDEAPPLVPFNPNRKVLQTLKDAIANLESEGIQRLKEKRLLIKAIRLAERTSNFNKKKLEEEESD